MTALLRDAIPPHRTPFAMAAKGSKSSKSKSSKSKSDNRCWSGYEPTPGKKPYEKGSCKPKRN
jgi:hypothetical protein